MKISRAILSGILVWSMVFALFIILSFTPVIKDSTIQQNMIVFIFLIPFAAIGAYVYYKKGNKNTNGFVVGLMMVATSLFLDAIITVPYVIVPQGGSYSSFFTDPFLAIISAEFITTIFLYWKLKVKHQPSQIAGQ